MLSWDVRGGGGRGGVDERPGVKTSEALAVNSCVGGGTYLTHCWCDFVGLL